MKRKFIIAITTLLFAMMEPMFAFTIPKGVKDYLPPSSDGRIKSYVNDDDSAKTYYDYDNAQKAYQNVQELCKDFINENNIRSDNIKYFEVWAGYNYNKLATYGMQIYWFTAIGTIYDHSVYVEFPISVIYIYSLKTKSVVQALVYSDTDSHCSAEASYLKLIEIQYH